MGKMEKLETLALHTPQSPKKFAPYKFLCQLNRPKKYGQVLMQKLSRRERPGDVAACNSGDTLCMYLCVLVL